MPIPIFKAPVLDLESVKVVEIPFSGLVGAGAQLTLVSNMITYPFRILQCKMVFDRNARNLVHHYWLYAGDREGSTTGVPSGDNIYQKETPLGYFLGESLVRTVNSAIDILEVRRFIKLHTVNGLAVGYYINASITIQEI